MLDAGEMWGRQYGITVRVRVKIIGWGSTGEQEHTKERDKNKRYIRKCRKRGAHGDAERESDC